LAYAAFGNILYLIRMIGSDTIGVQGVVGVFQGWPHLLVPIVKCSKLLVLFIHL